MFNFLKKKNRRRGIIRLTGIGAGWLNRGDKYNIIAEVEEVDRIGEYSKLRLISANMDNIRGLSDHIRLIKTNCVNWHN